MFERRSLKWPILLAVVMIVVLVALTVGWILLVVATSSYQWILLTIGSILFVCVVVGVVLYLVLSIQTITLNRRQSNFIDSVTHELKSPIASLKLYLQTLGRRNIDEPQRQEFYKSMLADVERLDQLINHLLEAARLEHRRQNSEELQTIRVDEVLSELATEVSQKHVLPMGSISLHLVPMQIEARPGELNILFRNLLDNAAKYAGEPPQIEVHLEPLPRSGWLRVSILDNGSGIPRNMRRRIFGRFVRLGNELERTKPGTGLGLFLVRSMIRQMRGRITVVDRAKHSGTRFDVQLPGASEIPNSQTDPSNKAVSSPEAENAELENK